jgi:dihydroflavonol-4-reductase
MLTLVTGATGHIGANLVRALLHRGRAVRVLIHERDIGLDGLTVERVHGDVRDRESLDRAMEGVEVVFHLAAVISIQGEMGGLVPQVNVQGARQAAEAALAAGVRRFVHCSSIHAFDQSGGEGPLDETSPRSSSAGLPAYDRSKAAGEAAVREVIARGLDAVVLHPSSVIGPHDYRPSRMGQVLIDLHRRRLPALVSGGFDWVDVRDVVDGLLAAEQHGRTGESYLLHGRWTTVRELAELAAEVTGVRPPRLTMPTWVAMLGVPFMVAWAAITRTHALYTAESLRALRANSHVQSDKAARELAYRSRPLEQTLRDSYAWFEQAGVLQPPVTS